MSDIIFGITDKYVDIWLYLYHLYLGLSLMSPDLFLFDKTKVYEMSDTIKFKFDRLLAFLNSIINLALTEENFLDEKIVTDRNIVRHIHKSQREKHFHTSPEDILTILYQYASLQVDLEHWGGDLDFLIFASFFNINFKILEVRSKGIKQADGKRLWSGRSTDAFNKLPMLSDIFNTEQLPNKDVFLG